MDLEAAIRDVEQALESLGDLGESSLPALELAQVLQAARSGVNRLERITVAAVGVLERQGGFAELGYRNHAVAVSDLTGCAEAAADRFLRVAKSVGETITLHGEVLPVKLPATAAVFSAGRCGVEHVDVLAKAFDSDAAKRLAPEERAGVEQVLAEFATMYSPRQLKDHATSLIDALDQDGAEPDDGPLPVLNQLRLQRHSGGRGGGKLYGRFDDAALYDAIATVVDAMSKPLGKDDDRSTQTRQAEGLADACSFVLDHAGSKVLAECGGRKPHLNVTVSLEELEYRARNATLEFGGKLSPESLRTLCCDAKVVPIVLGGKGQPLDVGRASRTATGPIRRGVTVRDRGCAKCGRPPSWAEIHHINGWEHGDIIAVHTCVMLCKACHRLMHHAGWKCQMRDGLPEFIPPKWIDPQQRPRQRARPA